MEVAGPHPTYYFRYQFLLWWLTSPYLVSVDLPYLERLEFVLLAFTRVTVILRRQSSLQTAVVLHCEDLSVQLFGDKYSKYPCSIPDGGFPLKKAVKGVRSVKRTLYIYANLSFKLRRIHWLDRRIVRKHLEICPPLIMCKIKKN